MIHGLTVLNLLFALIAGSATTETAASSPWLSDNFSFTWAPPGTNLSVPTTAQCDAINITWTLRNDGSPDPVPPFFLHVYTSTLQYPLIVNAGSFSPFEWVVPFVPDTQYQICMFDSKGRTGGCQDGYTVMPPKNASQTCNDTLPRPKTLAVKGATMNGPLTPYGWPDQCTDISLSVSNGTPPFVLTVAPSLHPPLNLTFQDHEPMNWTLTLGWGMQFWISLADSMGASWAYGPLHSGGNGPTDCLQFAGNSLRVQPPPPKLPRTVSAGGAVGIAIGSLIFGIFLALGFEWLLLQYRKRGVSLDTNQETEPGIHPRRSGHGVDPYPVNTMRSRSQLEARNTESQSTSPVPVERNNSHVYVVHHDAGGAPITIFTGGRDVQELPPHYSGSPEPSSERRTHTPSTSMDSTGAVSHSRTRSPKQIPPTLRSVTN